MRAGSNAVNSFTAVALVMLISSKLGRNAKNFALRRTMLMLAINQKKQVLAQATLQSGTSIKNRRLASNSYTVVAKRTTTISRRRSRVISNAYSQVEGKNKTSAFYPLSWVSVAITLNDGITTPTSSIADNTITVDVAGMRITS